MADEVRTESETQQTTQVTPEPPVIKSGMNRMVANQLKVTEPAPIKIEEQKPTYDYSFIKDLSKEDLSKYEPLKEKDEALYHQTITLANDVKKNQRLVSERETELAKLRTLKSADPTKHQEFVEALRKDGVSAYKQYQTELDLPELEIMQRQMTSGGDVQSRLEQWQSSELIPGIESKHKIDKGTFTYEPGEAYKAGTPSYDFRVETEKREKVLTSEVETVKARELDIASKVKQQTDQDMKFLRETYFPDTNYKTPAEADEAFVSSLNQIDENQEKIRKGDFDPALNPYSLRNIFRGINFDALSQARVDREAASIHAQYNAKGLFLPNNEQKPTNLTEVKGNAPASGDPDRLKRSPMLRRVNQSLAVK